VCLEPNILKTSGDRDSVSKGPLAQIGMGNRMVT